ncbi:hypothetical protein VTK26DRAFT_2842 [Humicola hyalothermophila]
MSSNNSHRSSRSGRTSSHGTSNPESRGGAPGNWQLAMPIDFGGRSSTTSSRGSSATIREQSSSSGSRSTTTSSRGGTSTSSSSSQRTLRPSTTTNPSNLSHGGSSTNPSNRTQGGSSTYSSTARMALTPYRHPLPSPSSSPSTASRSTSSPSTRTGVTPTSANIPTNPSDLLTAAWAHCKRFLALYNQLSIDPTDVQTTLAQRFSTRLVASVLTDADAIATTFNSAVDTLLELEPGPENRTGPERRRHSDEWERKVRVARELYAQGLRLIDEFEEDEDKLEAEREVRAVMKPYNTRRDWRGQGRDGAV